MTCISYSRQMVTVKVSVVAVVAKLLANSI